jgi:hypothetical protein
LTFDKYAMTVDWIQLAEDSLLAGSDESNSAPSGVITAGNFVTS